MESSLKTIDIKRVSLARFFYVIAFELDNIKEHVYGEGG